MALFGSIGRNIERRCIVATIGNIQLKLLWLSSKAQELFLGWQDFLSAYMIDQMSSFEIDQMRSLFIVGQICTNPLRHDHDERAVIHVHPIVVSHKLTRRVSNEWTVRIDLQSLDS